MPEEGTPISDYHINVFYSDEDDGDTAGRAGANASHDGTSRL